MTLDQMRYFLSAAKYQSVTKAARAVNISASSVSTAISAIEEELGCLLFSREGKLMLLTEEGRTLQKETERIFEDIEEIKSRISMGTKLTGEFRIGASPFLSSRHLARAWTRITNQHEGIRGEIVGMHTATLLSDLVRGVLDFALCFSPQEHPELKQTVVHKGQLRIAVKKGHPILKSKGRVQLAELSNYSAIIHKSSPGVDLCDNHPVFAQFGIKPNIRSYFDGDDQAIGCLLESQCWTLIPDICITENSNLEMLPAPRGWDAVYRIAAVVPLRRKSNRILALLTENIATAIGE